MLQPNLGTISLTFTALAVAGTDGLTEESSAVRLDLIATSTPLFLVDLVVLEILVGLLVWYTSSFTARFATYLVIELLVLMTLMVLSAIWVWRNIRILIRLGQFNSVETDNDVSGLQVRSST
ncbi:hypothetical protein DER44DRAFT_816444 [Fusarium oxysporum]|nr:hypothetical protein DER44DRAFT_816444 [Fusarium oxysporum]